MPPLFLYYLCALGGLAMIVGSMWLLFKEKIFLDAQTKQVLYVELPIVGRLKTNAPTIFLVVLGVAAMCYPLYLSQSTIPKTSYLKVQQKIASDAHPVTVYLVLRDEVLPQDGNINLPLPSLSDQSYTPELVYVVGTVASGQQPIPLEKQSKGVINLADTLLTTGSAQRAIPLIKPSIKPKPEGFQ